MNEMISPRIFEARRQMCFQDLPDSNLALLRPVLPSLLKCTLNAEGTSSGQWYEEKNGLLGMLLNFSAANDIMGALSVDFRMLLEDSLKGQHLRMKAGSEAEPQTHSVLDFESGSPYAKLSMVVGNLLSVISQLEHGPSDSSSLIKSASLVSCKAYQEDIGDLICIAVGEMPNLLSIGSVVEVLLYVDFSCLLTTKLAANLPEKFNEICKQIIVGSGKSPQNEVEARIDKLKSLCSMNPGGLNFCINLCIQHMQLAGFIMWVLVTFEDRMVTLADHLLLGEESDKKTWFCQHIRSLQESNPWLASLRGFLMSRLQALSCAPLCDEACVEGIGILKLCATLRSLITFKYTDGECMCLCTFITASPPRSKVGANFLCVGVCFVISCQQLLQSQSEKKLLSWLRLLSDQHKSYEIKESPDSIGQLLLLVAIHFHGNNISPVIELAANTLQIKANTIKSSSLSLLKIIFTQDVFTEQVVAAHAAEVPVTKQLNDNMSGFLPIQCVHQLLKSRTFSKHRVQIKDWIYAQIMECTLPLHHTVPALIKAFVTSLVPAQHGRMDKLNAPLTEQEVSSVFMQTKEKTFTVHGNFSPMQFSQQVVMLYYVLAFQEALSTCLSSKVNMPKKMPKAYGDQLLVGIPVQSLVSAACLHQEELSGLYAPLVSLLIGAYSHLCLTDGSRPQSTPPTICEELLSEALTYMRHAKDDSVNASEVGQHLLVCRDLQKLMSERPMDRDAVCSHLLQATCPPPSLQASTADHTRCHMQAVKKLWLGCALLMPKKFLVESVHNMQSPAEAVYYNEQDLCKDPLIVLKCADKVYRTPDLMELMLKLLEKYLEASATHYDSVISASQNQSESEQRELKFSLNAITESVVVQTLLERCTDTQESMGHLTTHREVQGLICSFIHRMFIKNPSLIKLIIFQGFDSSLLPLAVSSIPSMHVSLEHISELLSLPDIEKQVFAVQLIAALSHVYPLPRSHVMGRLAINILTTLIKVLPREAIERCISPILPDLERLCQTFPPLNEEWSDFVVQFTTVVA